MPTRQWAQPAKGIKLYCAKHKSYLGTIKSCMQRIRFKAGFEENLLAASFHRLKHSSSERCIVSVKGHQVIFVPLSTCGKLIYPTVGCTVMVQQSFVPLAQ